MPIVSTGATEREQKAKDDNQFDHITPPPRPQVPSPPPPQPPPPPHTHTHTNTKTHKFEIKRTYSCWCARKIRTKGKKGTWMDYTILR